MNLKAAFDKFEADFIKFDRIADPPSMRSDICAFLLLDKLVPGTIDMVTAAEHDEIWLQVDCDVLAKVATEDDILYLVRCGVRYDDDTDSLAMFV